MWIIQPFNETPCTLPQTTAQANQLTNSLKACEWLQPGMTLGFGRSGKSTQKKPIQETNLKISFREH